MDLSTYIVFFFFFLCGEIHIHNIFHLQDLFKCTVALVTFTLCAAITTTQLQNFPSFQTETLYVLNTNSPFPHHPSP